VIVFSEDVTPMLKPDQCPGACHRERDLEETPGQKLQVQRSSGTQGIREGRSSE
jgi:hypothetical protein